jgi:hypothetical protein
MKKTLRQKITGYVMPAYMADILTMNCISSFLSMSIISENSTYMFSYETGRFRRLVFGELDLGKRLTLIMTLIRINELNEDMLITAENYLIEPELIYSFDNRVVESGVRILFYPDMKRQPFEEKMIRFIEKITDRRDPREVRIMENVKNEIATGDMVRVSRYLEKMIKRNTEEQARGA